jgi:hypothetical protein
MLVLVAVLMGLTALVATLAPPERLRRGPHEEATPTPQSAQAGERPADRADVTATLSTNPDRKARTVQAELGDQIAIIVDSDVADSVNQQSPACRRASSCSPTHRARIPWSPSRTTTGSGPCRFASRWPCQARG